MESVAVLFLAVLLAGYFVLAGCDVGLGMLAPYVARTPAERRRVVSAAAPYFLGSEVWLVAAVGVVAGLFPELKSEVVSGQWPFFVALLAGWLWRDAGLWLRGRVAAAAWHAVWDAAVAVGSWLIALSWGLVLAALLGGGALSPVFAPVCVGAVVLLFLLRGAAFGAERLVPADGHAGSESADAAARATRTLARAGSVVLLAAVVAAWLDGGVGAGAAALAVAVAVVAVLAVTAGVSGPRWSRLTSAAAMAALPVVVAVGVDLPVAVADPRSLTLVAAAVAPMVPAMAVGQVWLYRMVRRPAAAANFFA